MLYLPSCMNMYLGKVGYFFYHYVATKQIDWKNARLEDSEVEKYLGEVAQDLHRYHQARSLSKAGLLLVSASLYEGIREKREVGSQLAICERYLKRWIRLVGEEGIRTSLSPSSNLFIDILEYLKGEKELASVAPLELIVARVARSFYRDLWQSSSKDVFDSGHCIELLEERPEEVLRFSPLLMEIFAYLFDYLACDASWDGDTFPDLIKGLTETSFTATLVQEGFLILCCGMAYDYLEVTGSMVRNMFGKLKNLIKRMQIEHPNRLKLRELTYELLTISEKTEKLNMRGRTDMSKVPPLGTPWLYSQIIAPRFLAMYERADCLSRLPQRS